MATTNSTATTLTKELRAAGYAETVKQGRGYVYLAGGDADGWYSSSIAVCYTSDIAAGRIVGLRNDLAAARNY